MSGPGVRSLRVPPFLAGDIADLPSRLGEAAAARGVDQAESDRVIHLLSPALLNSPCFFNRLTSQWCYDFGLPVDLQNEQIALGSPMFPRVDRLFDVLLFAARRLAPAGQASYLHRLADESRHQDVVAEMLVMLDLHDGLQIEFEVPAETGRERTIDWRVHGAPHPPLLFDVKNRMGDAAEFLSRLTMAGPAAASLQPTHDHALLFQGVLHKFVAHHPTECVHGVWSITKIQQEETELQAAFSTMDADLLHFAVISNMSRECYLLTRNDVDREALARVLNLSERPDRVVFRRSRWAARRGG